MWLHAVSITVTPRVALLSARDGAPGVQLVDAVEVTVERAQGALRDALPTTSAPGASRMREWVVPVLEALPPERRARLRSTAIAADGGLDLRFGTVVARWGRTGADRPTEAVEDALFDAPGIVRLNASAPRCAFPSAARRVHA